MPLTAVYPGTFDPITLGHENVVSRASQVFDQLIVAVARGHHKTTLFDVDERVALLQEVFANQPTIKIISFNGLLIDCAKAHKAQVIVRGLRSVTDYDFEAALAGNNRVLDASIETFFMTPDAQFQHTTSSIVREIARLGGDVSKFVSSSVQIALKNKLAARKS
jgi:pantetheine-phosphate adenylyltransferase